MIEDRPMHIRPESPGDIGDIHHVHAESFPTTLEAKLVDALRDAGRLRVSLVAEERGAVVGHVAFSPVTLPGSTDGVGLGPVAVLPDFRRRGIADKLIRAGLAQCMEQFGFVVVLGDPRYYHRFGCLPAAQWKLSDEYGGGDAFQAMELRAGAIPAAGGIVRYAPEFALVDG
jgi:putative acetyltransferase